MKAYMRRRIEMATRVRDFLRVHTTDVVASTVLTRLEALLERAHHLTTQQHMGLLAARGSTEHRAQLRRALEGTLLRCFAAVGVVAARENVELGAFFRLPTRRITNQDFATLAKAMLDKATEQKDVLISHGLSESLFADIAAALEEFDHTLALSRSSRLDHVGATGDLKAVATEILEQVRLLDALVRYRFGDNAEQMAAWASARNVAGPVRSHDEADAGEAEKPSGAKAA